MSMCPHLFSGSVVSVVLLAVLSPAIALHLRLRRTGSSAQKGDLLLGRVFHGFSRRHPLVSAPPGS
ncbi:MAG: hypothetical protein DLM60_07135 [Pseudonocardiales bacterium]|nr:MAG: hypothetical protein DLM60_07135 [Pseudonocardiales bacterium]